jgi:hypothetical protein
MMDIDALAKVIAENLPGPYEQSDTNNGPGGTFDLNAAHGTDTAEQWRAMARAVLDAITKPRAP